MSLSYKRAIVRPPGKSYVDCISTHPLRHTINVEKAQMQHVVYCKTLEKIGLELIRLKPSENHPDGCFVEDCAIAHENISVICRFAPGSRIGEEIEIEKVLCLYKKPKKIRSPATLEGGDVLQTDKEIFVGITERTNRDSITQLAQWVHKKITAIELKNVLHLKSICTYLGHDTMLVSQSYSKALPFSGYDIIEVLPEETYAANCLSHEEFVIAPKGYDHTITQIRDRGFRVFEVETSEFRKGNGEITCLALVF